MDTHSHIQLSHAHYLITTTTLFRHSNHSYLSICSFFSFLFSANYFEILIFLSLIRIIILMDSLRTCSISLASISRKLSLLNKFRCWSRRKSKKKLLDSDFSWLTESFPTMEVSNQLKQVFKFIDSNGDGKISPLELSQVLLSLGLKKSLATKEAEVMVREMDYDGDGLVDLEEFMSIMCCSDTGIGSCAAKEDDFVEAFLIFDTDKNGFISAKELQRVLISLGCQKCSLRDCRRMIKGVDKDGDGFVNFEEFKSMMNAGYRA